MTHDIPHREKARQSGPVRSQKQPSGALLAAVSILSASLGVTAAQAAGEIKTDAASAPEFNTRIAQTQTSNQLKTVTDHKVGGQLKTSNPNTPKTSNQEKVKGPTDPAVLLNPQPLPPEHNQ